MIQCSRCQFIRTAKQQCAPQRRFSGCSRFTCIRRIELVTAIGIVISGRFSSDVSRGIGTSSSGPVCSAGKGLKLNAIGWPRRYNNVPSQNQSPRIASAVMRKIPRFQIFYSNSLRQLVLLHSSNNGLSECSRRFACSEIIRLFKPCPNCMPVSSRYF